MQHDPTSITNNHADAWKNPASLGFSVWRRHTAMSLSKGGEDSSNSFGAYGRGNERSGLRTIYDRHTSFAGGFSTRQHQQNESSTDAARFVYASPVNTLQRYSYSTMQSLPALLQRKPYRDSYHPGLAGSSAVGGTIGRIHESESHTSAAVNGPLPLAGSVSGQTRAGGKSASINLADSADSRQGSIGPSSLSISSSAFEAEHGARLAVGSRGSSMFGASLLINRLIALSSFNSPTRSEEGMHRKHKRTGAMPEGNAEAGSVLNTGLPNPIHNFLPRSLQGRSGVLHIQPSGKQRLPVIPLVAETAKTGRTAAPTTLAIPFGERASERFIEAGTHHADSPGSISYVLRRFLDTSPPKAPPLPDGYRAATGSSVLTTVAPHSIAVSQSTRSTQIPLSTSSFFHDISNHFILRRTVAPFRLLASAEERSGVAFDATQDVATHPLRDQIQHVQQMQPRLIPKHGEHAQKNEGSGSYGGYGRYEAGTLSAVQRLQDQTSLFAAHRRVMTPQLSVTSVHSPGERYITQLSRFSERTLEKKPAPLPAAEVGPYGYSSPRIQLSRVSPEIASGRDSLLISRISRGSMTRSEKTTGRDHAAIPDTNHIWRRVDPALGWSMPSGSNNAPIDYSGSAVGDHSVSAIAANTRSTIHSPAFLPLSRQTGITRSIDARSASSMDTGPNVGSTVIGSTGVDPMGVGSIDSNLSGPLMAPDLQPHTNGPLLLKLLNLPRSIQPMARRAIARSAEQQPLSISNGRNVPAHNAYARDDKSFSIEQSISPPHSGWTPESDGRPLSVLQHAQNKLMRVTSQEDGTLAAPNGPEHRYGLVSPPGEPMRAEVGRPEYGNKTPESGSGQPDPEETAEHVWRIMAERLVIEQERRGLARWP